MKRSAELFLLFLFLSIFVPSVRAAKTLPYQDKVVQVLDGKTIRLSSGDRVQLQGIKMIPGKEIEARKALNEFVLNKQVSLQYEPYERDRYGLAYAYIFVKSNVPVNRQLIDKGVAVMGDVPDSSPHKWQLMEKPPKNPEAVNFSEAETLYNESRKNFATQILFFWGAMTVSVILFLIVRLFKR